MTQVATGADQTGPAVEIAGLSKAFGRASALRDLDLEVRWGEVLVLLGPNGSGKSTLVRVLAGLTKPDSGEISVAGHDLSRSGTWARSVTGAVTHDLMLYGELTGLENLTFFSRMFGLENAEERIASAAERMGMGARLHQRVGTLSHGMQKRLNIARALLHDPWILLLDEPESGLDQEALHLLEETVSDRAASQRAVLMTTHNLERGLALADRLAIIAEGSVAHLESSERAGVAAVRDAYFRRTGVVV